MRIISFICKQTHTDTDTDSAGVLGLRVRAHKFQLNFNLCGEFYINSNMYSVQSTCMAANTLPNRTDRTAARYATLLNLKGSQSPVSTVIVCGARRLVDNAVAVALLCDDAVLCDKFAIHSFACFDFTNFTEHFKVFKR